MPDAFVSGAGGLPPDALQIAVLAIVMPLTAALSVAFIAALARAIDHVRGPQDGD